MNQQNSINFWIARLKSSGFKTRIIVINAGVFIVFHIINFLFGIDVFKYFTLEANLNDNIVKPWAIASYGFVHRDFIHLLVNLIFFYYVVDVVLTLFPERKLISIYMFGIIIGGACFLISNAFFFHGAHHLEGASAGIIALFSFICFYRPQMLVYPFGLFPIKIIYILLILIGINFIEYISRGGGNVDIFSHLGGLLVGFWLSKNISMSFLFPSIKKKKPPISDIKKHKTHNRGSHDFNKSEEQKRIDIILDKISRSGYNNLTKEEKDFLNKQSR